MSAKVTERDELGLMARFLEFAAYYAVLETCLCVGAIGVCVWPQRETAKWLSRLLWVRRQLKGLVVRGGIGGS